MEFVDTILNKNIPTLSTSSEPAYYSALRGASFEYGCLGDPFDPSEEARLPSEILGDAVPPTFAFSHASPAASINNNYCREESGSVECFGLPPCTSAVEDEHHLEEDDDADFNSSVLNCLPTSCDELELKEMKLKLERVGSSPLVSARVSPNSGRSTGASSRHSIRGSPIMVCDPTPPDEDDLEVQMINESFEEQQKQTQLYETTELKSLFYHCSSQDKQHASDTESEKSRRKEEEPSPAQHRMPYTAAISAQASLDQDSAPERATPDFLRNPLNEFEPVLTPKSEAALIQNRIAARLERESGANRRRVSEPLALRGHPPPPTLIQPQPSPIEVPRPLFLRCSNETAKRSSFNSVEQLLKEKETPGEEVKMERARSSPTPIARQEDLHNDETEALAMDVIESLFAGAQLSPAGPSLPSTPLVLHERPPLTMSALASGKKAACEPDSKVRKKLDFCLGNSPPEERSRFAKEPPKVEEPKKKTTEEAEVLDSWEDFDDEFQPIFQTPVVPPKAPKPKPAPTIDYLSGPTWDEKKLPHVLEGSVPATKKADDVREALAELGFGEADVFPVDALHYLCIFGTPGQALDAQVLHRHAWLRLRPLKEATTLSQKTADMQESRLVPRRPRQKQSGQAARRMVENALGIRSTVSREQRAAEKRELQEAKAQKQQRAALWDDF